ncbi:hypothetical protein [Allorhodopirellula solitaria]|uniref:Uncharacterized protein n=1 Tax=Allorhodopirellula solitaria TaxID=2527987 RepID=A0A5C5XR35_9BACT|nr:hypothetical protein [Allorhodopirellula solitaria]TWT65118.1 hypothetical protein CA85_34650 [Allorhodopirellula solitaria]
MSMQTITTSPFPLPRALAPTLANSFAMMGAPRPVDRSTPSISVTSFHSVANLGEIFSALDHRFASGLGVIIEAPDHWTPQWDKLARRQESGGRLAVVLPPHTADSLPAHLNENEVLAIDGWDAAANCGTIDHAIAFLFSDPDAIDQCYILRPEWHDPSPIFSAVGRRVVEGF